MKQLLFAISVLSLAFAACNNGNNGNNAILSDDTSVLIRQHGVVLEDSSTVHTDTVSQSGEMYVSSDGKKKIQVRYFESNNKLYAGLTFWPREEEIILEQIPGTAFAKGADYSNDQTKWQAKGDAGVLEEKDTSTHFVKSE